VRAWNTRGVAGGPGRRLLVLWDVDHTLVETRGVGARLYREAFEAVTGCALSREVDVTGLTEQAIFAEAVRVHGVAPDSGLLARYLTELTHRYEQAADQLRDQGRALPGAREALVATAARPEIVQSVLTGNIRAVAVVKLRTFGLDGLLDLSAGAYGDDAPARPDLVPIAQLRASQRYAVEFGSANTVLIGDSPGDIDAAHRAGARAIAVATGKASSEQLRRAGAEVVLDTLAGLAVTQLG
jgi:phosphoglycolate phosphatase